MLERIAGDGAVSWKYQHSDDKLRDAFIIRRHFYSHGGSFSPCLFFPSKETFPDAVGMSEKCQMRTSHTFG